MSGKKRFLCAVLGIVSLLTVFPCVVMMGSSLMGEGELKEVYGAVLGMGEDRAAMRILPKYLTLRGYAEILLDSPGFFVMFWNSVKQTACVLAGQMAVALPAAWAFARYRFRGRRALFITYVILMVLPFQVTMVSSYLVLDKLSLIDTHLAVILPGIFSTFPVFIMEKFFRAIPKTMIEAAEIDGANAIQKFFRITVPLMKDTVMINMIIVITGAVRVYDEVYVMTSGGPGRATQTLATYLYQVGFKNDQMGYASAIAFFVFVVTFVLGLFQMKGYDLGEDD